MTIATFFPPDYQQISRVRLPLAALDTKGGVVSILNPFGFDVLILRAVINVTTKSTGACTLDIGIDADGSTGDDTLLDGLDVGTAVILADNIITPGTNGLGVAQWDDDEYVVASMASGAAAGVAGYLYLDIGRI